MWRAPSVMQQSMVSANKGSYVSFLEMS